MGKGGTALKRRGLEDGEGAEGGGGGACQKYEGRTACTVFWFLWPICIPHVKM